MKNLKMVKDSLKSICLTNKHLEVKDLLKKQKFWMNKYGHFALDRKETEIFYKIANFIKNEYKIGNLAIDVSEKDIENYLLILISKVLILSSQQKKIKLIESFEIDFNKQINDQIKNYELFFPILDLTIQSRFSFGIISFYPFSNYQLNEEMKFIKNLFKQNTVIKEKQKWIKFFRKELSFYVNQSMAKCTLKGTFTAAKLKSFNVTLLHINLLKFLYYDIMNNKPNRVKSITKTKPFETFFKTNDSFKTSSYFPVRLNINLNEKTYFETKAAKSFSKILKKEIYDDVENRILSSINWAVSSIEKMPTASDESNFFDSSVYMTPSKHLLSQCLLNIMIAFETLLLFNDERNKKELLKYRSLSLLENTDFRDSFITEQISNAYKLRSEIVHEGKFNQSPKSVFQLYLFFRNIVFELLALKNKEKIKTNDQLKKWFLMKEHQFRYEDNKSKFNESKKNQ